MKNLKIQRTFIIGDKWLYYKIYCGTKTTDYILSEIIRPLVLELKEKQFIKKWFFIRYADPDHHLRLRFRCRQPKHIGNIIALLNAPLKQLMDQDLIWKVQMDTYQRELERYGSNTIELAETLFQFDSEMITGLIDLLVEGIEADELRWMLALRGMDALLSDFDYSLESKKELLFRLKIGFASEFHMNKNLKKQVNEQYRKYRNQIEYFMHLTSETADDYLPLLDLLEIRSKQNKEVANHILNIQKDGALEMDINELLASFIHMFMNRLFKSKNRLYEMVAYDFLYRYYMACISKEKSKRKA